MALLGTAACQAMAFVTVHHHNIPESIYKVVTTEEPRAQMATLMTKHQVISRCQLAFDGGLGRFYGKAHLDVDLSIPPVIITLRRVSASVRDRLDYELAMLEERGAIRTVTEPTSWVSGLVVAEKKNGALRICIDPKP